LLATVPLWIETVGLFHYIGVEILVWVIYGLAFNLRDGHGWPRVVRAWPPTSASARYAFGLAAAFHVSSNLWVCLGARR
jgi:branched-chain amino acid transport system permease protein